jgi:2-iminoacetate synthase
MEAFGLDVEAVAAGRARAAALAERGEMAGLVERAWRGEPLADEALTALFLARAVATEELLAIAAAVRRARAARLETFSPLYITNECDAECRMCGMRRDNTGLARETADRATVAAQLDLLYRRGLRGVAVLTGEYHRGARRAAMIARAAEAVRLAFARGFTHVLVNIGALDAAEYATLLADLPRGADGRIAPRLTMCTFQETYDPAVYARFMGTATTNPRSDFVRRLTNFDRAADAGMRAANPGVLLGLNPDLAFELLALLAHLRHLARRGMRTYVSLPRLRRASGAATPRSPTDDALARLAAVLAFGVPEAQVVISTREPPAVQQRLLPAIGVLTPGSPGVAPYTETGARFDLEASQFEVHDHRPLETILGEIVARGTPIDGYEPARV